MTVVESEPALPLQRLPLLDEADGHAIGDPPADTDPGDGPAEDWELEPPLPPLRVGLVVATSVASAGIIVGSVFEGLAGRVLPSLAGLVGIAVATQASRRRSAIAVHLTIVSGILATGLLLVASTGLDNVIQLVDELRTAGRSRSVLRPPAEFLPGFRAIVGWLMAGIGFAAGWVALELRRPALGLLAPLPLIVFGAISVPDSAKLPVGVVTLVLLLLGLTLLSSLQSVSSGESQGPSLGYELRRAVKVLPMVGVLVVGLVLAARSNLLFPDPLYDPVRDAQRPKAVPLSQVEDRVLFEVRSRSTGPWRIGLLDVYDGQEWRLPAFAESDLERVPGNGIVDQELGPATRADFLIKGLGGAVLPGLPNTVSILARGPKLGYDRRTGNIRLVEGQIRPSLTYTVAGAALPTEEQLLALTDQVPEPLKRFTEVPDPPPAVAALLAQAPATPAWARLQFLRKKLFETVTASGAGTPVAVPPSKVDDMLAGSKEGTPFEIVAAQALLARWAGVPARIGYGYDGGELISGDVREVRPRHGSSWLEVYFPGFKWFPVTGAPLKAKAALDSEGPSNADPTVVASDEIAVEVFIPLRQPQRTLFFEQVRRIVLLVTPVLLLIGLLYLLYPVLAKAVRRSRRRAWARAEGVVARIEVSYAEFRDYCTDLGIGRESDTPLRFLGALSADDEHLELAWLVTRALYGDLRDDLTEEDAFAADELSRALCRRVAAAQPLSLRAIAQLSRLSLKNPYAPQVRAQTRRERRAQLVPA